MKGIIQMNPFDLTVDKFVEYISSINDIELLKCLLANAKGQIDRLNGKELGEMITWQKRRE